MAEFHILGQCKSLLSKNETLDYDMKQLRSLKSQAIALKNIEKRLSTSYSAAILLDAAPTMNIHAVVCEGTLPNRHNTILSFVFESALGNDKDPYRHLLLKCWPLRCWTRKFVEVTASYFDVDPSLEAFVNHLVLCALLGNYQHNTMRPPAPVRRRLYAMLDYRQRDTYNTAQAIEFRRRLLGDTKRVYLHAVQEYICTTISSNPALVRQVQHMMPFEEFQSVVVDINDQFRSILVQWDCKDDDTLMKELTSVVEHVRSDILDVSYEKPVPPFIEFLKDIKSHAKPSAQVWFKRYFTGGEELVELSRQGYVKPSTEIARGIAKAMKEAKAAEEEEEEEDEDRELEDKQAAPETDQYKLLDAQIEEFFAERKQQERSNTMEDDKKKVRITMMHITMDHSRQLERLISHFDPGTAESDDILRAVIKCFPAFGCTDYAAWELRALMIDYKIYKKAKEWWKEKMLHFSQNHPYAYCLLQATRRFISALRQIQSFPLPINVMQAQLHSIETKHGTTGLGITPEECIFFYACRCCRQHHSLIQAFKNNHKQNYTEGRREVLTDLRDGRVYCKKGDVFAHRQCSEAPVMQILALGKLLLFRKKAIVYCCQPGCGARPMQVDPDHTTFNEHGIACFTCTLEILRKQREEYQKQYPFLDEAQHRCFLCNKAISKQYPFFLMAAETVICHRHKKQPMKIFTHIQTTTPKSIQDGAFTNKLAALQIRAKILEFKEQQRQDNAGINAKRNQWILRQLKRNKVAARGGHS